MITTEQLRHQLRPALLLAFKICIGKTKTMKTQGDLMKGLRVTHISISEMFLPKHVREPAPNCGLRR